MADRTCSLEGCTKGGRLKRGWCEMHYCRWRANGDPLIAQIRTVRISDECSIDGCTQFPIGRGWCGKHYQRWAKYGDPLKIERVRHTCSIEGCDSPVMGHSWCSKHYQRWCKYGDPLRVAVIIGDDETRFWFHVDKNGPIPARRPDLGACWSWTGTTGTGGYGRFHASGSLHGAHRWICELKLGPIPDGYEPDHLCFNTSCVNYESHLEVVTQRENILRSDNAAALNARKTHCDRGHEFTAANTHITVRTNGRLERRCRVCGAENQRRYRAERAARNLKDVA